MPRNNPLNPSFLSTSLQVFQAISLSGVVSILRRRTVIGYEATVATMETGQASRKQAQKLWSKFLSTRTAGCETITKYKRKKALAAVKAESEESILHF